MHAYSKSQIADAVGVSPRTLARWLKNDYEVLSGFGVSPTTRLLPPSAVKYLVQKYDIDLS